MTTASNFRSARPVFTALGWMVLVSVVFMMIASSFALKKQRRSQIEPSHQRKSLVHARVQASLAPVSADT
jgi:hypothetical protein